MPVTHRNQNVRKGLPSKRSPCPVAFSLDIFGDRWTLLVIRDLFYGRTRFKEFVASPEGIPTNILTDRLERLLDSRHSSQCDALRALHIVGAAATISGEWDTAK